MISRSRIAVFLLTLGVLAACGPLPRPFAPDDGLKRGDLTQVGLVTLHVMAPEGAPERIARPLAEAVAAQLGKSDIAATAQNPPVGSWVLSGIFNREKRDIWNSEVDITWRLSDPQGQVLGERRQTTKVETALLAAGAPQTVTILARASASEVAQMVQLLTRDPAQTAAQTQTGNMRAPLPPARLPDSRIVADAAVEATPSDSPKKEPAPQAGSPSKAQAAKPPAPPAPPSQPAALARPIFTPQSKPAIRVEPVTGAPGDGNKSLTSALRAALLLAGLKIAPDDGGHDMKIIGKVLVEKADSSNERVEIVWTALLADGSFAGEVRQGNTVPAASLNGSWGALPQHIAREAGRGVGEILAKLMAESEQGKNKP